MRESSMYGGIMGNIHQQHACDHDQLDQGCCQGRQDLNPSSL